MKNSDDEVLHSQIHAAKKGSQLAFKFLLDKYWAKVYNFQLKRTANEYEAEEITVQAFSKAFDKIETYDSAYRFDTWLISISKNLHIDLLRAKSLETTRVDKKTERSLIDEAPTAEDKLITEQDLKTLLRKIKRLKPHYREIIWLRFFEEMTYKQMAAQLQEPINNIKVKLLRAKKLLAEQLAD